MATSITLTEQVLGLTASAVLQVTSDFELHIPNTPMMATTGTIALIGEQGRQFDIQVGTGVRPGADEIPVTLAGATTQALALVGAGIATKPAADSALGDLDQAIDALQARRAELAAAANRLDHADTNVELSRENQEAARAALEDTNLAETITSFSRQQLLVQSGTATLAQVRDLQDSLLTGLLANTRGRSG
jgi:flagellin